MISIRPKWAGGKPVALRELLSQSDLITLHCPSSAQTRGLINADSLAITKPGLILVNLSRGDLVDSAALTAALQSGHVSAVRKLRETAANLAAMAVRGDELPNVVNGVGQ